MSAGLLADVVVVIHFTFVVFVVFGGLLAIWRPKLIAAHVPAALYGLVVVTVGVTCPLTTIERDLRDRAGEERFEESFIERYVEGVLYPGDMLREAQMAGVLVVIASWVAVAGRVRATGGVVGPRQVVEGSARGEVGDAVGDRPREDGNLHGRAPCEDRGVV